MPVVVSGTCTQILHQISALTRSNVRLLLEHLLVTELPEAVRYSLHPRHGEIASQSPRSEAPWPLDTMVCCRTGRAEEQTCLWCLRCPLCPLCPLLPWSCSNALRQGCSSPGLAPVAKSDAARGEPARDLLVSHNFHGPCSTAPKTHTRPTTMLLSFPLRRSFQYPQPRPPRD